MDGVYGGLVVIINYATAESVVDQELYLITDNNLQILTDLSQEIIVTE